MGASDLIIVIGLAVGAFVFRDQILDFAQGIKAFGQASNAVENATKGSGSVVQVFGDTVIGKDGIISGKEASLQGGGKVFENNLKSNFSLQPLPDDPLFGSNGFFTNLFNLNKDSNESEIQKQASQVGLSGGEFFESTDTKPVTVTELGNKGKRGKSAFL